MVDRQYPLEWKCRGTVPRHFLSKNAENVAEIYANVKKNAEH